MALPFLILYACAEIFVTKHTVSATNRKGRLNFIVVCDMIDRNIT
jgi:hypothetical protein